MMRSKVILSAVAVALLLAALAVGWTGTTQAQVPADEPQIGVGLPDDALIGTSGFVENLGQWDIPAGYHLAASGMDVWLTPDGFVYQAIDIPVADAATEVGPAPVGLPDQVEPETVPGHVVFANYLGERPQPVVEGLDALPGYLNWIVGDVHVTDVKSYETVVYRGLYEGIDAYFTSVERAPAVDVTDQATLDAFAMDVTYAIAAGADPADIQLRYEGADSLSLGPRGQLLIETSLTDITETLPLAYQYTSDGRLKLVTAGFALDGDVVSFEVADYDANRALFIDPLTSFSREFGGTSTDTLAEMHEDDTGRYFTGFTYSSSGFPTTSGAYNDSYIDYELYALKFDLDNNTQQWGTYYGSEHRDYGGNSDLLDDGSLVLVGSTYYYPSPYYWNTWPKPNSPEADYAGNVKHDYGNCTSTSYYYYHIGASQLSPDGKYARATGTWCSGSSRYDYAGDIEYHNDSVYITGSVNSNGLYGNSSAGGYCDQTACYGGSYEPYIIRSIDGKSSSIDIFEDWVNFTFVPGGSSTDGGAGLAFDSSNNVYAFGHTSSTNYPYTTKIGPGGNYDLWVAKFPYDLGASSPYPGSGMNYNTLIGGSSTDPFPGYSYTSYTYYQTHNSAIMVEDGGRAWITGASASTDFPVGPNGYQPTNGGNYDVFVIALNTGGTAIDYGTFIGGTGTDVGRVLGKDSLGNIYVGGLASSSNYPTLSHDVQPSSAGGYDFVRSIFNPDLSDLICSTYYGSTSTDYGEDMEVDQDVPYLVRMAGISAGTWPVVPGGSPTFGQGGGYDGVVTEFTCGGAALEVQNAEYKSIPLTHQLECLAAGDMVQFTFDIFNLGLSDQEDRDGPEFQATASGPMTLMSCVATLNGEPAGDCQVTGSSVMWNGRVPSQEAVSFDVRGRVNGGVSAGTEMCLKGLVNYDGGLGYNSESVEFELCALTDCPPTVDPNRQLGMQVHLPIMNYIGNDDRCNTWIEIQNVSGAPVKAVLVTWGEPGFCPPQAAGPLKVECTGLLKPGSTWNLVDNQIPTGSKSGMLFKFSTRQLSDDGLDLIFGFDDIYADLMCETLFFGVVGDSDDWRRFKKAYNEGGTFAGIPLDLAAGFGEGGILAVDVLRDCPADVTAGARVTSKYNGIAGSHLGMYDPVYGAYAYYVPLVYADKAEFNSWIYIQNGGLECSSVEVWFQAQDDCMRARICEVMTLAPGETYQLDANDCVGPQWQGSAWIRTSQPMGIAVDIVGRDVLMTYIGEPAELNYTFDPSAPYDTQGNQVAFGPLVYSEYQGWDSGIQVQNLSPVLAAKVKVYFLDRSGDIITTLVDWICPRGSQTFFLPVVHDLPGNWAGSIRVESQEWVTPGGPLVVPPNIVGVATMIKYSDAQRTETREAIAYNLLPEHKIYDWQLGFGGGGLDSGIGLIAIPSLIKDLDGTGVTTEIAIANVVPKPGFTDFVIFLYDQNGLVDYVCEKLNEKQVEYIDLQTWGYVGNGFKGSAIISAVFWEHDVFDDTGFFLRNVLGLGAVSLERSKTRLGEDIAGDEAAGSRGIPFRQSDVEDEEFEFGFMPAGRIPTCPGVPDQNPELGEDGGPQWVCPPTELTGTFGAGSPDWSDYDTWTAATRIFRDGVPSECQPQKACPSTLGGGGNVDAYYFDNPQGKETCVEIAVTHQCGVNCMTYATSGRFQNGTGWPGCPLPGAPEVDYLGDVGGSGATGRFGFTIPSGVDEWSLIFGNVSSAQACQYSVTISGFDCQ